VPATEIKFDGYRVHPRIVGGKVTFLTRGASTGRAAAPMSPRRSPLSLSKSHLEVADALVVWERPPISSRSQIWAWLWWRASQGCGGAF